VGGALATIAGVGVIATASPAGALVTVATSGTTMTVTLTGAEVLDVKCISGVVSINTKTGSPTVPCATFSKLTVNGDSAKQEIDGHDLEVAAFAAKPYLVADLNDGPDIVDTHLALTTSTWVRATTACTSSGRWPTRSSMAAPGPTTSASTGPMGSTTSSWHRRPTPT